MTPGQRSDEHADHDPRCIRGMLCIDCGETLLWWETNHLCPEMARIQIIGPKPKLGRPRKPVGAPTGAKWRRSA